MHVGNDWVQPVSATVQPSDRRFVCLVVEAERQVAGERFARPAWMVASQDSLAKSAGARCSLGQGKEVMRRAWGYCTHQLGAGALQKVAAARHL